MSNFCMYLAGFCGVIALVGIAAGQMQASMACALTGILWLLLALTVEARERRHRQPPPDQ